MRRTALSVALLVGAFGCDDAASSATEKSAPTASASATASAEAPAKACAPGLTEVAALRFCIKVPSGYKLGEVKTQNEMTKTIALDHDDVTRSVHLRATTEPWDDVIGTYDRHTDASQNDVKDKGEFLGGKGKWFHSTPKSGPGATSGVYVRGPSFVYICELAGSSDGPEFKELIEICKTIQPLE